MTCTTVEPPNQGHFGTSILSFGWVSYSQRLEMNCCYKKGAQKSVLCWPRLSLSQGSFIRGSTVLCMTSWFSAGWQNITPAVPALPAQPYYMSKLQAIAHYSSPCLCVMLHPVPALVQYPVLNWTKQYYHHEDDHCCNRQYQHSHTQVHHL